MNVWPDTLSISNKGEMYYVANNLCDFIQGFMNYEEENFHLLKVNLGTRVKSYTEGCLKNNGSRVLLTIISLIVVTLLLSLATAYYVMRRRVKHNDD
jgi:hypothetical protein